MREVVKSVDCSCGKIEIVFPSLSKEEIYLMVQFLYTGRISNLSEKRTVLAEVLDNLTKLLGFPNCMQSPKGIKTVQNVFEEVDRVSIKQPLVVSNGADQNCLDPLEKPNHKYMECLENIEFDEKVECDKKVEFDEKVELDEKIEFDTNSVVDEIEDEDAIDSLDDLSFPNETGNTNVIEEKAIIKIVELGAANSSNMKQKEPIVMIEPLNFSSFNSDSIESDIEEIHKENISVETETKIADLFDLSEKTHRKLTANDTHKHTSVCFTSKWANQNSNLCPLLRGKKVQKTITIDEFLNNPKDFSENSKNDEKAKVIEPEEKSEKNKENALVKNVEVNDNELESSLNQYEALEIQKSNFVENQNHECEYCLKSFEKYSTLNRHLSTKRCKNYPKRYSKRLSSAQTFLQFQCSKCNLSFSKEWRLLQHQKENHEICKEKIEILSEEEGIKKCINASIVRKQLLTNIT